MGTSSEDLEALHDRALKLDAALGKLKGAEVTRSETVASLAQIAKDWLRVSTSLRSDAGAFLPSLDSYDQAMTTVLAASKQRSRATAYRERLKPFLDEFLDKVVIPLIRYEGSPGQVAARQLESVFGTSITTEEEVYVKEAARCSSVQCHRAAIVLLWAAAMARLHTVVQKVGFDKFNSAAAAAALKKGQPYARLTKGITVDSLADLQRARDFDLMVIGLELWKYDSQVFDELNRLLGTRNSAAHPGMFEPGALDVRQFADKLRKYVFELIK